MARIKPVKVVITRYGTYSLHYTTPDGRRRRLSVGSDYQQAQRLSIKFTDWLLDGKDPECEMERTQHQEQARAITLREFFPVFRKRHGSRQSKGMQARYEDFFKNICRCIDIAESPIGLISKRLMLDYMQARLDQDEISPATVNREAAFVRGMLSRAVEWDIIDRNPLQGLRLFKEAGKREVNLSLEQAAKLLESLPKTMADIVEFAIYTGFRKENILGLRIEQIRFHDLQPTGEVQLLVKGGRSESFPLGPHALGVLKRQIGDRLDGYVFRNPRTGMRYKDNHCTFDRAVRRLSLTVNGSKLRFHDLRHVFATWLHQAGVSLDTLRPLLGHRDRATTDRYTTINRMAVSDVLSCLPEIRKRSGSNG
ncbi:tyrosine recombinase XerC [Gemmatimonadota bacterium]